MAMAVVDDDDRLYIPEDAVMEILARLPVKSLLQFKCVCKSWYALIKNPSFITKHLNYASKDENAARIVVIDDNYHNDDPYTTTVLSNDGVEIYHDLPNSFLLDKDKNLIGTIELSGPCNGIVCICDYDQSSLTRMALWNPAIREFKYLILDDGDLGNHRTGYDEVRTMIGFGLNTETNVYKVVRCRKFIYKERSSGQIIDQYSLVDVYDVGNDSWRKLDDVTLPVTNYHRCSVYADGFCYWSAGIKYDDKIDRCVLSFDFTKEVFERILLPPEANNSCPRVTTFGESMAFFDSCPDLDCHNVWVLYREGDKKTWNKQFPLPHHFVVNARFLRSGNIVMLVHDQLVLYDPSSQELKKLMDFHEIFSIEIMNYVESLVSFKKCFPPCSTLQ